MLKCSNIFFNLDGQIWYILYSRSVEFELIGTDRYPIISKFWEVSDILQGCGLNDV